MIGLYITDNTMNRQIQIAFLWLLLVVCMILHFDYHVSGIFYGVDVKHPDATGSYPPTLILIRGMFQILPMTFCLLALFFSTKAVRLLLFILALLYVPMHGMHVVGTLRETPVDPTQVQLLIFTFLFSLLLAGVSFKWYRSAGKADADIHHKEY